uniref:Cingulin b n=1 Tax=Oryzias latipes TaxID=8090 RepID=A0A3P9L008_ORYLA
MIPLFKVFSSSSSRSLLLLLLTDDRGAMSTLSSDRKPLVDYGVQIRFIKDLHDTGGGFPDKSRGGAGAAPPSNKYGVAVRVQGISGQPYVVLKDGDKGDSYGVQLTTPTPEGYSNLPKPKEPAEVPKRYSPAESVPRSPAPPVEDEEGENFGSPLRRPPGDGQAGTQGDEERGGGRSRDGERPKPEPKATFGRMEITPGRTVPEEYNEAGLKPVWSTLGPRKFTPSGPSLSSSLGRYQEKRAPPPSPQQPRPEPPAAARGEPAAAIDTNSLAPINKLISKFNSGTPGGDPPQTRGRSGARQRLNFDERTRSRSLDARKNSEPEVLPPPSSSSVGTNEEAPPPPSSFLKPSAPVKGSVGNGPATVAKEERPTWRPGLWTSLMLLLLLPQDVMVLQGQLAEVTMLHQRQEEVLHQRERELTALKGALKEEVECHDREMESLREQYSQDMENLRRTMEQFTQVSPSHLQGGASLSSRQTNRIKGGSFPSFKDESSRNGCSLHAGPDSNCCFLSPHADLLQSKLPRSSDPSEELDALEDENRALKSQLEDAKRGAGRLAKERDELSRRLEERELEREVLKKGKVDLEEQKRQLDRALEKITKEMEMMVTDSRQSVATLQTQLDDFRERSRKELLEAQRNAKDRQAELQRAQAHLKGQQEEVSRLKKELLTCSEDRDGAQLERDLLSNRLKHLESELESERTQRVNVGVSVLQDKIKTLEIELDEERNSVELLNDRITRSREQVDQLRSELMQERSARHDLEMDKSALERQVKELKSRLADMEGQARPSAGLSLLETKLQEMEDRLRSEEREKATIQASLRRTERKLKDVTATLDQERSQHVEQRDQLSLRVKGLKRQVDESESEVERLEGVRRKILRELEEQQELQEALQAKVTALENDSAHFSSEEEEDGFPDSSLSSLLHESSLQTSSC